MRCTNWRIRQARCWLAPTLAAVLGLKKRGVSLSAGGKSRDKVLQVQGLAAAQALDVLRREAES